MSGNYFIFRRLPNFSYTVWTWASGRQESDGGFLCTRTLLARRTAPCPRIRKIIKPHHRTHRILHQRSAPETYGGTQPDWEAPPEDIPDNGRLWRCRRLRQAMPRRTSRGRGPASYTLNAIVTEDAWTRWLPKWCPYWPDCNIWHSHKPSNGPNISHVTTIGEALLRSTLEKTRCPVPSGHLPVLFSATSNGFYQKNHVVPEMRIDRTATAKTKRGGYV